MTNSTLLTGGWLIHANGFNGLLNINSVDTPGDISGNMIIQNEPSNDINGFWDGGSQRITFMRIIKPDDPSTIQVYTGYLFVEASFGKGGIANTMAGYFEAFQGTGAVAQRTIYGWYAIKL